MLYIVHLDPALNADLSAVQEILNLADDWHLVSGNCWIIETDLNASFWSQALQPFAKPGGGLFVCRLDPSDRNGWKPKSFWAWLRQHAPKGLY